MDWKKNIKKLVQYLDNMEEQFRTLLGELKEIHTQVETIQDQSLKAKVKQVVGSVENKMSAVQNQFQTVKNGLIQSAGNTVTALKEQGITAVQKAVKAMKTPEVLHFMKDRLQKARASLYHEIETLGTLRGELRSAGYHMRNAGRSIIGKEPLPEISTNTNKGILVKVQKMLLHSANRIQGMETRTEETIKKLEKFQERSSGKYSIRQELKEIKHTQGQKPGKEKITEQTR